MRCTHSRWNIRLLTKRSGARFSNGDEARAPVHSNLELLSATGDRPLGIQAAQLIGIERWLRDRAGVKQVRLESTGPRSQVTALVAAALEPALFSDVGIRDGMESLTKLLDGTYEAAPNLFCLDQGPVEEGAITKMMERPRM